MPSSKCSYLYDMIQQEHIAFPHYLYLCSGAGLNNVPNGAPLMYLVYGAVSAASVATNRAAHAAIHVPSVALQAKMAAGVPTATVAVPNTNAAEV